MVKIFVLIAVSVVLFCAYPVAAQSQRPTPGTRKEVKPPQKQSATQQQKAEPDKRGTEQTPLVVKTIPAPKSQAEAEEDSKEHKNKTSQGWWTIWLTAAVAVATFLQAFFLWRSLRETQKAANAAVKSAGISETALHITQRAYVDVIEHRLNHRLSVGRKPQVVYEIANFGNTPAQITEISQVVDVVSEFPIEPDYSKCRIMYKNLIIQQHSTVTKAATMDNPISNEQIIAIDNRNMFLGLWGKITYYDAFQTKFTIGFGVKRTVSGLKEFAFIDGYNYTTQHEEQKEQS